MTKISGLAALLLAAAGPASACLNGWDCCKWDDPKHQTPKYVIGRIIAGFPHNPAGLRAALPIIQAAYPGTEILSGKGDKIHVPCVGTIDVITAAGGPNQGDSWWWGVDVDECGRCSPNRCESASQSSKCGGGSSSSGSPGGTGFVQGGGAGPGFTCAGVQVPNEKAIVEQTVQQEPEGWKMKLETDEGKCRADSRYLDAVVDNLRRKDRRWGFNCKRGNCNDPSHDVVAYYFGKGEPYEGAPQVMLVDMITSSCAPDARPGWLPLEFGEGAGWTSKGRFPSGPRQNIVVNCPKGAAAKESAATVAPLGGGPVGGGGGGGGGGRGGSGASPNAARSHEPHGLIGGNNQNVAPVAGPGEAEPQKPGEEPAQDEEEGQ